MFSTVVLRKEIFILKSRYLKCKRSITLLYEHQLLFEMKIAKVPLMKE